jgi:predicted HicB family RNase H-like nuclease
MAKKNFDDIENPAFQFITQSSFEEKEQEHEKPIQQISRKELKRKRLNLLIQPSLYDDLTKIAYIKRMSVNELICQAAKEFRDNERRALDRYKTVVEEKEE